ncbi:MAG: anhydro-N-acetylmuramic acid kinase [Myxococcota bacterium]
MARMQVIGLMSGTSADAIDAALVEWPSGAEVRPFHLLAYREEPLPGDVSARIHRLAAGQVAADRCLAELSALDALLGERFSAAALAVAREAGVELSAVDLVASHGQTIAHHPELGASLQIGNPSRIAAGTGCLVVADFRSRDLALGGQGAPLAPFFHHAVMAHAEESRLVLNLGGIANLTWLPALARAEEVRGFDVGPANVLLDSVIQIATKGAQRMDRDGDRAQRGRVDPALLARLLDDEFLGQSPPKSTGRERYGWAEAEGLMADGRAAGRGVEDLLATLVAFSARAVRAAVRDHLGEPPIGRVLVGGGGVRNSALMEALAAEFAPVAVEPFDVVGIPVEAAEAMAFSLMGRNTVQGLVNHLPACTGATRSAVLGVMVRP